MTKPGKPAKPSLERELAAIRALDPAAAATVAALREAIARGSWLVVAAAANHAGEHALYAVADDLAAAYARFEAPKADPNYAARTAIVQALAALSRWHGELVDRALATIAPVAKPQPMRSRVVPAAESCDEDTAAALRVAAVFASVAAARPEALDLVATLLGDPAPSARREAARALAASGLSEAGALARYKLEHIGDIDDDVLQALAEAILALQPARGAAFLATLLVDGDRRAEIIAVALGAARATECFDALVAWSNALRPDDRARVGFLPLALLRDDGANAWLGDRIATGSTADALAAALALATFVVDPQIAAVLRDAAARQRDATCRREILALLDDL